MAGFVPDDLTGVWRREIITAPGGYSDAVTRVFWLQTRSWYGDMRIGADRPAPPGARGFADMSDAELIGLAAQQGFAGELSATSEVCLWRRDLDVQPPSATPDEATYAVEGDRMVEDGIHSEYQEIWRLQPQSRGLLAAFRLAADDEAPGRDGLLLLAGDHFMEVLGRTGPLPAGASLAEIVAADLDAGRRAEAEARLSLRICHGRITGGDAPWRIALSTFPWLEGSSLWAGQGARVDVASGALQHGARRWRTIDSSAPAEELAGVFAASLGAS